MKVGFGILAMLCLSCWLWERSIVPFWERTEYAQAETREFGIVIHGHNVRGWVRNTNEFPVRIRSTWVFNGETNLWEKVLQPGEQIKDWPGHQVLYHVYRLDDSAEAALIQTSPNGPKSPDRKSPF